MSKSSGGTRTSHGSASSAMPRKSPNQLTRYDGERVAAGSIKVKASHLSQISDRELGYAENNLREALMVRGTAYKTSNEYTAEEKRLQTAISAVQKEIKRRERPK